MPVVTDPRSDRAGVSTRQLLLACLPAVAIGVLISARGLDPQAAERNLHAAVARADVAVFVLARALVEAFEPDL